MSLKNTHLAVFALIPMFLGLVLAASAEEKNDNKDKVAVAGSAPAAAKPAVAAQPASGGEDTVTEEKFKKDADSAEDKIQESMGDLRNIKRTPLPEVSPEDRAKAEKAAVLRQADEIDAKLRAQGIWDTDAGRQSMGTSSYLRGDYAAAIGQFTRALGTTKDPNVKTWILGDRGEAYFRKGDKKNALKDLTAAITMKAADKGPNIAELAFKLGRTDDAKRETELAAAYQRSKTPGFVANWGVCSELSGVGKPAEGCMSAAISDCFHLYGTDAFGAACAKYEAEAKYLKESGYPCPKGNCKTEIKTVTPPAAR